MCGPLSKYYERYGMSLAFLFAYIIFLESYILRVLTELFAVLYFLSTIVPQTKDGSFNQE